MSHYKFKYIRKEAKGDLKSGICNTSVTLAHEYIKFGPYQVCFNIQTAVLQMPDIKSGLFSPHLQKVKFLIETN